MSKQTTINPRTGKRVVTKTPQVLDPLSQLEIHLYGLSGDALITELAEGDEKRVHYVIAHMWRRLSLLEKENAELKARLDARDAADAEARELQRQRDEAEDLYNRYN